MYADVCVMPAQTKLFPDGASNVVMPFKVCEGRDHLPVQAYGIQAAMFDFLFSQIFFFEVTDALRV